MPLSLLFFPKHHPHGLSNPFKYVDLNPLTEAMHYLSHPSVNGIMVGGDTPMDTIGGFLNYSTIVSETFILSRSQCSP